MRELVPNKISTPVSFAVSVQEALNKTDLCANSTYAPIACILKSGNFAFISKGSHIEVVNIKSGSRKSACDFNTFSQNRTVTCVTDCGHNFLVGLRCHNVANSGIVCIYDPGVSRIIKVIKIVGVPISISVVHRYGEAGADSSLLSYALKCLCGIVAVGTEDGHIYLLDLRADDDGELFSFSQPSSLLLIDPENIGDVTVTRRRAKSQGKHCCIDLAYDCFSSAAYKYHDVNKETSSMFSRTNCSITSLAYLHQSVSLLVGFSFGCFQIWSLEQMNLAYSSSVITSSSPVTHFAFQEPENDPRHCCFLWVGRGPLASLAECTSPTSITLYQLVYNTKETKEGYGILYKELNGAAARFGHQLTADVHHLVDSRSFGSRIISLNTLDAKDSTICFVVWETTSSDTDMNMSCHLGIFDLNRWYEMQLPSSIRDAMFGRMESVCPFFAFYLLTDIAETFLPGGLLDVYVVPNSINWFRALVAPQSEQFFWPSSASFKVICLSETGTIEAEMLGMQRQITADLIRMGTDSFLNAKSLVETCWIAGLLQTVGVNKGRRNEDMVYSDMLLSVALENGGMIFIISCIKKWSHGSITHAGHSLKLVYEWAWAQVVQRKKSLDDLHFSIFNCIADELEIEQLNQFRNISNQLKDLSEVFKELHRSDAITLDDGIQELEIKSQIAFHIALYTDILLVLVDCRLLPEQSPTFESTRNGKLAYNAKMLSEYYESSRKKSEDEPNLFIDVMWRDMDIELTNDDDRSHDKFGLYPPNTVETMCRLFLQNLSNEKNETCLLFYYWVLDVCECYKELQEKKMTRKFKEYLRLDYSEGLLVEAAWLLDHKLYNEAGKYLLTPGMEISVYFYHHIVRLLHTQEEKDLLSLLFATKPPNGSGTYEESKYLISVLLEMGKLPDAYRLQGSFSTFSMKKNLFCYFIEQCIERKMLRKLMKLPIRHEEEVMLRDFLESSHVADDYLLVYYLERGLFCKASQVAEKLKASSALSFGQVKQDHLRTQLMLANGFLKLVPEIQQKRSEGVNTIARKLCDNQTCEPPLSSILIKGLPASNDLQSPVLRASLQSTKENILCEDIGGRNFFTNSFSKRRRKLPLFDGDPVSPTKKPKEMSTCTPETDEISILSSKQRKSFSEGADPFTLLTTPVSTKRHYSKISAGNMKTPQSILKIKAMEYLNDSNDSTICGVSTPNTSNVGKRIRFFGLESSRESISSVEESLTESPPVEGGEGIQMDDDKEKAVEYLNASGNTDSDGITPDISNVGNRIRFFGSDSSDEAIKSPNRSLTESHQGELDVTSINKSVDESNVIDDKKEKGIEEAALAAVDEPQEDQGDSVTIAIEISNSEEPGKELEKENHDFNISEREERLSVLQVSEENQTSQLGENIETISDCQLLHKEREGDMISENITGSEIKLTSTPDDVDPTGVICSFLAQPNGSDGILSETTIHAVEVSSGDNTEGFIDVSSASAYDNVTHSVSEIEYHSACDESPFLTEVGSDFDVTLGKRSFDDNVPAREAGFILTSEDMNLSAIRQTETTEMDAECKDLGDSVRSKREIVSIVSSSDESESPNIQCIDESDHKRVTEDECFEEYEISKTEDYSSDEASYYAEEIGHKLDRRGMTLNDNSSLSGSSYSGSESDFDSNAGTNSLSNNSVVSLSSSESNAEVHSLSVSDNVELNNKESHERSSSELVSISKNTEEELSSIIDNEERGSCEDLDQIMSVERLDVDVVPLSDRKLTENIVKDDSEEKQNRSGDSVLSDMEKSDDHHLTSGNVQIKCDNGVILAEDNDESADETKHIILTDNEKELGGNEESIKHIEIMDETVSGELKSSSKGTNEAVDSVQCSHILDIPVQVLDANIDISFKDNEETSDSYIVKEVMGNQQDSNSIILENSDESDVDLYGDLKIVKGHNPPLQSVISASDGVDVLQVSNQNDVDLVKDEDQIRDLVSSDSVNTCEDEMIDVDTVGNKNQISGFAPSGSVIVPGDDMTNESMKMKPDQSNDIKSPSSFTKPNDASLIVTVKDEDQNSDLSLSDSVNIFKGDVVEQNWVEIQNNNGNLISSEIVNNYSDDASVVIAIAENQHKDFPPSESLNETDEENIVTDTAVIVTDTVAEDESCLSSNKRKLADCTGVYINVAIDGIIDDAFQQKDEGAHVLSDNLAGDHQNKNRETPIIDINDKQDTLFSNENINIMKNEMMNYSDDLDGVTKKCVSSEEHVGHQESLEDDIVIVKEVCKNNLDGLEEMITDEFSKEISAASNNEAITVDSFCVNNSMSSIEYNASRSDLPQSSSSSKDAIFEESFEEDLEEQLSVSESEDANSFITPVRALRKRTVYRRETITRSNKFRIRPESRSDDLELKSRAQINDKCSENIDSATSQNEIPLLVEPSYRNSVPVSSETSYKQGSQKVSTFQDVHHQKAEGQKLTPHCTSTSKKIAERMTKYFTKDDSDVSSADEIEIESEDLEMYLGMKAKRSSRKSKTIVASPVHADTSLSSLGSSKPTLYAYQIIGTSEYADKVRCSEYDRKFKEIDDLELEEPEFVTLSIKKQLSTDSKDKEVEESDRSEENDPQPKSDYDNSNEPFTSEELRPLLDGDQNKDDDGDKPVLPRNTRSHLPSLSDSMHQSSHNVEMKKTAPKYDKPIDEIKSLPDHLNDKIEKGQDEINDEVESEEDEPLPPRITRSMRKSMTLDETNDEVESEEDELLPPRITRSMQKSMTAEQSAPSIDIKITENLLKNNKGIGKKSHTHANKLGDKVDENQDETDDKDESEEDEPLPPRITRSLRQSMAIALSPPLEDRKRIKNILESDMNMRKKSSSYLNKQDAKRAGSRDKSIDNDGIEEDEPVPPRITRSQRKFIDRDQSAPVLNVKEGKKILKTPKDMSRKSQASLSKQDDKTKKNRYESNDDESDEDEPLPPRITRSQRKSMVFDQSASLVVKKITKRNLKTLKDRGKKNNTSVSKRYDKTEKNHVSDDGDDADESKEEEPLSPRITRSQKKSIVVGQSAPWVDTKKSKRVLKTHKDDSKKSQVSLSRRNDKIEKSRYESDDGGESEEDERLSPQITRSLRKSMDMDNSVLLLDDKKTKRILKFGKESSQQSYASVSKLENQTEKNHEIDDEEGSEQDEPLPPRITRSLRKSMVADQSAPLVDAAKSKRNLETHKHVSKKSHSSVHRRDDTVGKKSRTSLNKPDEAVSKKSLTSLFKHDEDKYESDVDDESEEDEPLPPRITRSQRKSMNLGQSALSVDVKKTKKLRKSSKDVSQIPLSSAGKRDYKIERKQEEIITHDDSEEEEQLPQRITRSKSTNIIQDMPSDKLKQSSRNNEIIQNFSLNKEVVSRSLGHKIENKEDESNDADAVTENETLLSQITAPHRKLLEDEHSLPSFKVNKSSLLKQNEKLDSSQIMLVRRKVLQDDLSMPPLGLEKSDGVKNFFSNADKDLFTEQSEDEEEESEEDEPLPPRITRNQQYFVSPSPKIMSPKPKEVILNYKQKKVNNSHVKKSAAKNLLPSLSQTSTHNYSHFTSAPEKLGMANSQSSISKSIPKIGVKELDPLYSNLTTISEISSASTNLIEKHGVAISKQLLLKKSTQRRKTEESDEENVSQDNSMVADDKDTKPKLRSTKKQFSHSRSTLRTRNSTKLL